MSAITQTKLWEMYIDSARHAHERGQSKVAEEILINALNELSDVVETRKVLLIEVQRALANIYRSEGRFMEAEPLYRWALAMAEAGFGRTTGYAAPIIEDMATCYEMQGREDDARILRKQFAEASPAQGQPDGPARGEIINLQAKAS